MKELDIYQEERPWGNFRQFTHNALSTVKIITVEHGEMLSLQSHKLRSEFWHVLAGTGIVQMGEVKKNTTVGDEYQIEIGEKHRLEAGPDGIQVLEIAFGDFEENDIVHFEDKYGRV
jgi:mannose-1-phosphate guanylyltransferase/mannose-1-phosphate guanylyltransferase/mannose-6-phosphate isomerase